MSHFDWPLAVSVASNVAGRYPLEDTYHQTRLERDMPELVARASALVTEETGLVAPGSPDVAVIGRSGWVENNVASFSILLAPAEEHLGSQTGVGASIAGRIMGIEIGAVLGFLSRRVLGQYELVLPTSDGDDGDTVLFVGPNLLKMERDHAFRPDEFRFWIALHECTHRLQFTGVPWLRGYFLGLVEELVAAAKPESGRVQRVVAEIRESAANGSPLIDEAGIFGLFATPEQREIIDRVQALMALLEGHGHVVMDRIGERELVTQRRMSAVFKARRADKRTAALMRLIGLEMKLRQYEMGAEFINEVERRADWGTLDHAWESPESLPTLDEIENPERWLRRIS
ncbi:MAG: zinc-dependent metalloprotease [Actinomycetota bacterium]|nr:zinc-dependent metalloprotease [Actinomycetota bacterium]